MSSALERDELFAERSTPSGAPDGFGAVQRRRFNQAEGIRAQRDRLSTQ
ncbi:hypothetical protein C6A87_012935 [Mycobacterium sp. ITM-2016-00317]|nr:hypothetical protein [Mycobacterium sp. ITM-2016-00317]WNG89958.1 hypothetical protein C6A87_012935 [Mycobacterium sp. ITM-2016-00317]